MYLEITNLERLPPLKAGHDVAVKGHLRGARDGTYIFAEIRGIEASLISGKNSGYPKLTITPIPNGNGNSNFELVIHPKADGDAILTLSNILNAFPAVELSCTGTKVNGMQAISPDDNAPELTDPRFNPPNPRRLVELHPDSQSSEDDEIVFDAANVSMQGIVAEENEAGKEKAGKASDNLPLRLPSDFDDIAVEDPCDGSAAFRITEAGLEKVETETEPASPLRQSKPEDEPAAVPASAREATAQSVDAVHERRSASGLALAVMFIIVAFATASIVFATSGTAVVLGAFGLSRRGTAPATVAPYKEVRVEVDNPDPPVTVESALKKEQDLKTANPETPEENNAIEALKSESVPEPVPLIEDELLSEPEAEAVPEPESPLVTKPPPVCDKIAKPHLTYFNNGVAYVLDCDDGTQIACNHREPAATGGYVFDKCAPYPGDSVENGDSVEDEEF